MREKDLIQASACLIARSALSLFVNDQHRWSTRPYITCITISELIDEPWGCSLYAIKQKQIIKGEI